jgi:hypothetical protein
MRVLLRVYLLPLMHEGLACKIGTCMLASLQARKRNQPEGLSREEGRNLFHSVHWYFIIGIVVDRDTRSFGRTIKPEDEKFL